mmetsp:Transcript_95718/g.166243  ORF Transcript_95718/g.166243 Transcript_95718/m.166243 type:complete len:93 (-) Transcript_95718:800-1078(-)
MLMRIFTTGFPLAKSVKSTEVLSFSNVHAPNITRALVFGVLPPVDLVFALTKARCVHQQGSQAHYPVAWMLSAQRRADRPLEMFGQTEGPML